MVYTRIWLFHACFQTFIKHSRVQNGTPICSHNFIIVTMFPANKEYLPKDVPMLGQRRGLCANIETALLECFVFAELRIIILR